MAREFDANEIIVSLSDAIGDDIAETALAALTNVVRRTPVGNPTRWQQPQSAPPGYVGGHARRNWNVSINAPRDSITGTEGDGGGKGAATSEAISKGSRTIERSNPRTTQRIIISNSVPYIGRLNAGHSTIAPANFVEMAVALAVNSGRNSRGSF